MKKTFKDYAHFYLGCDCYEDSFMREKLKLVEVGLAFSTLCSLDGENDRSVQTQYIIPILRPLSDLTQIELEKIIEIGEIHYRGELPIDFVVGWKAYGANTFAYLLKQGFDLFNLIPDGIAIDKTTLNK